MSEQIKKGKEITIAEPWRSLAKKLGSVGLMAAELQHARRTVNQWARRDRLPSEFTQRFIVSVFEMHGIEPPKF